MPHADVRDAQLRAFGATLRALRREAGLTQERLSHIAGLERAYVGHIENGRRNVSLQTMWQLATALNVTPAEFFRHSAVSEAREGDSPS